MTLPPVSPRRLACIQGTTKWCLAAAASTGDPPRVGADSGPLVAWMIRQLATGLTAPKWPGPRPRRPGVCSTSLATPGLRPAAFLHVRLPPLPESPSRSLTHSEHQSRGFRGSGSPGRKVDLAWEETHPVSTSSSPQGGGLGVPEGHPETFSLP